MTDQHTKGAINKAKGKVEEGLGKLTGDRIAASQGQGQADPRQRPAGWATSRTPCDGPEPLTTAGPAG